jgi:adenine-specific DNA glycosylase
LQALMDFGASIRSRKQPRSNLATGLAVAELVQKSLDAMDNGRVEHLG